MFRTIDLEISDDPKFRKLSPDARHIFLGLIIYRYNHVSGLFILEKSLLSEHTGRSLECIEESFQCFIETDLISWDDDRRIIWVKSMWRRQPHHGVSLEKVGRYLTTLYETPLLSLFFEEYPELLIYYNQATKSESNKNQTRTTPEPNINHSGTKSLPSDRDRDRDRDRDVPPNPPGSKVVTKKKPVAVHDPERLSKILSDFDLSPFEKKYGSKIDVKATFERFKNRVVGARNPKNYVRFDLAFDNWCIPEIQKNQHLPLNNDQWKEKWLEKPDDQA